MRPKPPNEGVTMRELVRGDGVRVLDAIAVEEPLEIRLAGEPLAVTMRTPGDDRFLAAGFLFGEGIVRSVDELGSIAHCGRPGTEGYGNMIDVLPAPGVVLDASLLEGTRRGTLTTSACGVCGRRSIDDLIARIERIEGEVTVARDLFASIPRRMTEHQPHFATTGGVHAAIALTETGEVLAHAEDVGRHNAVDKTIGRLLFARTLPRATLLAVSGRVSFEIVQKAATAAIPIVAAVSAPSSLAIDLALRAGITLAAFVRGDRLNLYSHWHRVR